MEGTMAFSFKDFVLSLDESVRPEEAARLFTEQSQRLREASLAALKDIGLFFDMYHPLAAVRSFDLQVRETQRAAEDFLAAARTGHFAGLSLVEPPLGQKGRQGSRCQLEPHGAAPHFAKDPNENVLVVSSVVAKSSVWIIYDIAAALAGFCGATTSTPKFADQDREVRLKFKSAEALPTAGSSLKDSLAAVGFSADVAAAVPATALTGVVLPPEMSAPEQLGQDLHSVERTVRFFDERVGLPQAFVEELLSLQGSSAFKLDLLILYLRRVHHFCFYLARQFSDEWAMAAHGAAAALRARVEDGAAAGNAESAAPSGTGRFAKQHKRMLAQCMKTVAPERPPVALSDDAVVTTRAAELIESSTIQVTEAKFQCTVCGKQFKSADYVAKHFRKAHSDLIEKVRQDVHAEMARDAFMGDDAAPIVRTPQPMVATAVA